jgi:hypothetical protein
MNQDARKRDLQSGVDYEGHKEDLLKDVFQHQRGKNIWHEEKRLPDIQTNSAQEFQGIFLAADALWKSQDL